MAAIKELLEKGDLNAAIDVYKLSASLTGYRPLVDALLRSLTLVVMLQSVFYPCFAMPRLFDTHCHLDFSAFDSDRLELLQKAADVECERVLIPGVKRAQWDKLRALCQSHPQLSCAFGLHPYFIDEHQQEDVDLLAQWVERTDCIAVGECGLDWAIPTPQRDKQLAIFESHLVLAREVKKPLILHVRKAHPEMLQRLKNMRPDAGGVVHAYF